MTELDRKILLNLGPATTTESVKNALVVNNICPREKEFGNLLTSITEGLLKIEKGEKDYFVNLFTTSGTGAIEETVEARWLRYQKNWQIIYDGLKDLGFQFFLPMEQQSKILMGIRPKEKLPHSFDHFHDYLFERNITIYPGVIPETNTFRVAVIGETYPDAMGCVISIMRKYFSLT